METLQIHYSPVWGIQAINHVYIYSPVTKQGRGLRIFGAEGDYGPDYPYISTTVTTAQRKKLFKFPHWEKPVYIPIALDCHTSIEQAFAYAGATYPEAAKRVGRFENWSKYDNISELQWAFERSLADRNETIGHEIGQLLAGYIRTHHRFKDQTGKLTRSIHSRRIDKHTVEVLSDAPYVEAVMASTNENFFVEAIEANSERIRAIINHHTTAALFENQYRIQRVAESLGYDLLKGQFDQVLTGIH